MDIHREQYTSKGLKRYEVNEETGCWVWQLNILHGYGYSTQLGGRAHRYFYKFLRGKLTNKQILHHVCENKSCVNPWHCIPMTNKEHNKLHKSGVKMKLSNEEIERRRSHGKKMAKNFKNAYSNSDRSEVSKKTWSEVTEEERKERGKKISEARLKGIAMRRGLNGD